LNVEPSSAVPVTHVTAGFVHVGGAANAGAPTPMNAMAPTTAPTSRTFSLT
jgi:hypothetical protein